MLLSTPEENQDHNITCLEKTSNNKSLDAPPSKCCWMLYPNTGGLKLTLSKLSLKDTLIVDEINANMDVVSIWRGNHTCSIGLQKCPFNVHQILFSNETSVYRTIELQLDQSIHDTRLINVDLFTTQGKVSNGQL